MNSHPFSRGSMIKKIKLLIGILVLVVSYFSQRNIDDRSFVYNPFIATSYFELEGRDLENKTSQEHFIILKSLFIESVYEILLKEDLRSFSKVLEELKKPFVNFWIVKELIELVVNNVVYLFIDTKRYFGTLKILTTLVTFLFISLLYFKLYLKTYHPSVIVLRC